MISFILIILKILKYKAVMEAIVILEGVQWVVS